VNAEDDWSDMPPSHLHLAAAWPLVEGDHMELHADECAKYEGGEECTCLAPILLDGPTGFA
jgi:hypothetical protein